MLKNRMRIFWQKHKGVVYVIINALIIATVLELFGGYGVVGYIIISLGFVAYRFATIKPIRDLYFSTIKYGAWLLDAYIKHWRGKDELIEEGETIETGFGNGKQKRTTVGRSKK